MGNDAFNKIMKKTRSVSKIICGTLCSISLLIPSVNASQEDLGLVSVTDPIVRETYSGSFFLNKGQRKTFWHTFSNTQSYNQLAAFVAISYGDLLSVSCKVFLFDGNSRLAFKQLNCSRSHQWDPMTPDVPVLMSKLRAKVEIYNADWTKPSKQVSIILTPNFANLDDVDQDGMPAWFEILRNLSDNDVLDAASDNDNDGYTALEEYLGGSHPEDANSTP